MSKLLAITLSTLVLLQSLNFGTDNIVQLDELFEHAQFHKKEHGDNFFIFISKHYGELKAEHSKSHKEEKKEHDELPFQYQGHIVILTAFLHQNYFIETNNLDINDSIEYNFYYSSSNSSLHKKGLLQPPKHA